MNFGKIISELRKQKNITQEEMAAELGVTATAVSKWENGYTLPDILMLCALADYFRVTTDELLGRTKAWKHGVIAAETEALGQQIARIAKKHGITAKGIFTVYEDALALAEADTEITYIIAGFHNGYYTLNSGRPDISCLVSVHETDAEILAAMELIFQDYVKADSPHFVIN